MLQDMAAAVIQWLQFHVQPKACAMMHIMIYNRSSNHNSSWLLILQPGEEMEAAESKGQCLEVACPSLACQRARAFSQGL